MDGEQRTNAWFEARLGKVTASRVVDVMAKTKTGPSASRENYLVELALERITGRRDEGFTSGAMQWGTDQEPFARMAYESTTGNIVIETGFVPHPTIAMAGASPDGLIGDDGLCEIKCPNETTHFKFLRDGKIPLKYELQMLMQMACTGRQWCDYVSFDPRFPEELQLKVVRFQIDQGRVNEMELEIVKFLEEVETAVNEMEKMKCPQ